jgi:hypothetical protein
MGARRRRRSGSARWCAAAVVALVACREPPAAGTPEALAAYLGGVIGADEAARQQAVAGWRLDEPAWRRTVAPAYRPLYADYRRAFDAEAPALVARLAAGGPVTARRHFAGDPRLGRAQARDRWALPVLFPSLVAEAGGAPIDTVFVADGGRWYALLGLDAALRARIAALEPACAAAVARAGAPGRCSDVAATIADAALRTERDRLARLCRLAATLCDMESP